MADIRLVVHGHFYQPPRENPWTEEVAVEPSASPVHDWNQRITAECYRPNGWARVLDDRGAVTDIVNNFEHLAFDVGPTLASWLVTHAPDVHQRMIDGDRAGGGAIAQAYNHMILPLANENDVRTQVRWGLRDFDHRFGRPAAGIWLPETAVNETVLRILVEEGVRFTILAPHQAADGPVSSGVPFRWHAADGRAIDIVFYDGPISHDVAFGLTGQSSEELIRRVIAAADDGSAVLVATDGETFGHHHKWAERALAYAFAHEAASRGVRTLTTAALLEEIEPAGDVRVIESSWSCVHGVGRWKEDCGCHTGGEPRWNQRWRAPLRAALDVLRDFGIEVFERRGAEVLRDPWAARDAYVDVILGRRDADDFLSEHGSEHGTGDRVVALTLLEAQRHAMLMYTSCGWFFNDLAGIETLQVLRYAARAMDLLREIDEEPPVAEFLDVLAQAHSNDAAQGDGRAVWYRHVDPARVDADRVVGHLALVSLLEPREAPEALGPYRVVNHQRRERERGGLSGTAGRVVLEHRRTLRRSSHVDAAAHLGGLEVFGATRRADAARDTESIERFTSAIDSGERVTTLLRLIVDGFGPREFGLDSALPDAAGQIVQSAATQLAERFAVTYEHLYADHGAELDGLAAAGYRLPPELRAPVEFALGRRLEAEITAAVDDRKTDAFRTAHEIVAYARRYGLRLNPPGAAETMSRALLAAVERAVEQPTPRRVQAALGLLRLTAELDLAPDVDRAQELVFAALDGADRRVAARLRPLAAPLHLAV